MQRVPHKAQSETPFGASQEGTPMTRSSITHRIRRGLAGSMLALVVAASVALTGAAQAQDPVRGGSMTIINGSDIKSWDPAITNNTYPGGPMDMLDAVYGFLVYVDVKGQITGGMAESLTSEDAVTWTLKLRPGLKFTDGADYDAAAVKFNWDRAADPATSAPAQPFIASWNKSIKIVDPLTLTVTLDQPNASFAAQIAELAPFIASPAALQAAAQKTDIKPVGAGAFKLVSWDQGIGMTLERNPGYWDEGRPYLDELKFAIIPDSNSRIATVVQGGATMMAGYPYQFGDNASAPGVGAFQVPILGVYRAYFNQVKGPFADVRAREAFYSAIDRSRLMQAYTQLAGWVPPANYFGENSPFFDPAYALPAYNPERAQQLFNELAAEGKPFNIQVVTYIHPDLKRLSTYIQQMMSAYENASATITEVQEINLVDQCKVNLDFDICFEGGVLVSNLPEPNISNLFSSGGAFNWGQYKSEEMDAALKAANSTVELDGKKAAFSKVQELIAKDLPLYIPGATMRSLLLRDNTGGIVPSNGGILQKQFLFVCPERCID